MSSHSNNCQKYRGSLFGSFWHRTDTSSLQSAFRYAATLALFVLIVGGWVYISTRPGKSGIYWALQPSKVMAAEIITRSLNILTKAGTIYHQKTKQYIDGGGSFTMYEYWQDHDSGKMLNHVSHSDSSKEIWQLDNLDFRLDIDVNAREVKKDIYIYDAKNTKETVVSARNTLVDLAKQFNDLVQAGTLTTAEGKLNTRDVYVVTDKRNTPNKYWDVLTFDRNTFQLLQTERYEGTGSARFLKSLVAYEVQEALPTTPELEQKLFGQAPIDLIGYRILTRNQSVGGGPYLEYIEEDRGTNR